MLILTAPAKTLLESGTYPAIVPTEPQLLHKAQNVCKVVKGHSVNDIAKLMHVSNDIAQKTHKQYLQWNMEHTAANSRPALYCFHGEIFKAMNSTNYSDDQREYCNDHLRILSGLYGVLRPFDLMQPYRLEMGAKLKVQGKILREYWKQYIAQVLHNELQQHTHRFILNVASKEYFDSIDTTQLQYPVLHVDFKQYGAKGLQTYAVLAKKARGMMIDFCITTQAQTIDDVALFASDSYRLIEQTDTRLCFMKDR